MVDLISGRDARVWAVIFGLKQRMLGRYVEDAELTRHPCKSLSERRACSESNRVKEDHAGGTAGALRVSQGTDFDSVLSTGTVSAV